MKEKSDSARMTRQLLLLSHSICVGIGAIILILLGIILKPVFYTTAVGMVIGGAGGIILILSMSYSIDRAVMHDAQGAQKFMLKHYVLRLLVMLGLLLVGVFHSKWLLLGITLGLLCVKAGGYLSPKVKHIFYKK